MVAGNVASPGVFLNASAVLERQLTAFALDAWVREVGKKAKIPHTIRPVLGAVMKPNTAQFPYPWLDYAERNGPCCWKGSFVCSIMAQMS